MTGLYTTCPAVSFLMPCFNGVRWLRESMDAILAQTFGDFEVLVVDGGSKDGSIEILENYSNRDERIKVLVLPGTGLAESLNIGIEHARGAWIARIDADDNCEPQRLERQLAFVSANPGVVYVGTGLLIIDENGSVLQRYDYPPDHVTLARNLRENRKFPPHSSAFYLKDVVMKLGGYRTRIKTEDLDLWLRLSEVGQLAALGEPLVRIRKHGSSVSAGSESRPQKTDMYVSITSYWLRQRGWLDPVAGDDATYAEFRAFIDERVTRRHVFEYYQHVAAIKYALKQSPSVLGRALAALGVAVSEPALSLYYLQTLVLGERMASDLAAQWVRHRSSDAL
jgi:glycosyltransferase involved in cell wall biosynthesis